jgi:hypothetical protein
MKFRCQIRRRPEGWSMRHESVELGVVEVLAPSQEEAAEKMRGELRYRLELCPCSGESYQHLQIELVE